MAPRTKEETLEQPLAPLWLFRLMNPIMKALLHSPLHWLLSGTLLLLTYTGRKTGKAYTIPIGYFAWAQDELMSFSSARWWMNLIDGKPVSLLLQGRRIEAIPTVIHDRAAFLKTLETFITRLGVKKARMLRLGLPSDRAPTPEDVRAIPPGRTFIHFQITHR